jgi:hypothetical protein
MAMSTTNADWARRKKNSSLRLQFTERCRCTLFAKKVRDERRLGSRVADHVDWLVKPAGVGTSSDNSYSLRMKAKEFLRLAGEARDQITYGELKKLADAYMARALEVEQSGAAAPAVAAAKAKAREAADLLKAAGRKAKAERGCTACAVSLV